MKKSENIELIKIPNNSNMKDLYNKIKLQEGDDDDFLILKVIGEPDLNKILGQIKWNDLIQFKPEDEKTLE